jgi:hypothetical protein
MDTKQAELELSVIKKIMEDSRRVVCDNGIHYIFWGVLVTIAVLANYVMALMNVSINYMGLMWMILMTGGAITGVLIEKREHKKRVVRTFAGKLLGTLWSASGVAMFMFGFLGVAAKAYDSIFICPIIATVLGVSFFTSGAIQQNKWFQSLAYGWWAGAVVMFIFPTVHTLLIFGIMMIGLQTIPGIILFKRYKKELAQ